MSKGYEILCPHITLYCTSNLTKFDNPVKLDVQHYDIWYNAVRISSTFVSKCKMRINPQNRLNDTGGKSLSSLKVESYPQTLKLTETRTTYFSCQYCLFDCYEHAREHGLFFRFAHECTLEFYWISVLPYPVPWCICLEVARGGNEFFVNPEFVSALVAAFA